LFFIRIVIGKNTLAFELPDWLIFIIKVMIKTKFVCFIVIFGILSHPIHSQTDSLRNGKVKSYKLYYSSGFGYGSKGGTFGLGGIFVSSNNWAEVLIIN